jgi:hypothetical protein
MRHHLYASAVMLAYLGCIAWAIFWREGDDD